MTHSIILEVPESVYREIAKEAEMKKSKFEDVALERLNRSSPNLVEHSLDQFVGAFESDVPDWTDNHDKYLGENLMREMRGEIK